MEFDRGHVYDGYVTLERGIDSGRTPASLARNQASFAVNTTFRGGEPACRPGWKKRVLLFPDSDGDNDSALQEAFQDGQFQGATVYEGAHSSVVAAVGGSLYRISPTHNFRVTDISPSAPGSSRLERWWFCQAEEFLICQDNQMKPIIYDGGNTWRLSKDNELPVGNVMAYSGGRVWVALPDGRRFVAGDLAYSSSGTEARGFRDSVLSITDNQYLTGGGYFTVPGNHGGITSMVSTTNLDTSLGQGPLLILTPRLIASVQAPFDRTVWQSLSYPIQTIALDGYGALGAGSVITVNGDVFYRAQDGIRSFRIARQDFTSWGNHPISAEMNRVLRFDSEYMLSHGSSVVFDNRFLSTVSPYRVQGHGVPHRGIAVLDFDVLSRMFGSQPPAWEGVWTGLNVLKLVVGFFDGVERCFAFVLNALNQIELWELTKDYPFDYGDAGDSRVTWSIEFKALDYNDPFGRKKLQYGEFWIDDLVGKASFKAQYRPDQYPKWLDWGAQWDEEATRTQTMASMLGGRATPRRQYRAKQKLPTPSYSADSVEDRSFQDFFTVQPRLEITGHCRLRQMRIVARPVQEFARGQQRT